MNTISDYKDKTSEINEIIATCSKSVKRQPEEDENIANQPWIPYKKRKTITNCDIGPSCDIVGIIF